MTNKDSMSFDIRPITSFSWVNDYFSCFIDGISEKTVPLPYHESERKENRDEIGRLGGPRRMPGPDSLPCVGLPGERMDPLARVGRHRLPAMDLPVLVPGPAPGPGAV